MLLLLPAATLFPAPWPGSGPGAALAAAGTGKRPFPLLMPHDYPLARARALLAALRAVELPRGFTKGLLDLDEPALGSDYGRLALAALLAPPAGLAPPDADHPAESDSVALALRAPRMNRIGPVLRKPGELALVAALLAETEKLAQDIADNWPKNLVEAAERREEIEQGAEKLENMWRLYLFLTAEGAGPPEPGAEITRDDAGAALGRLMPMRQSLREDSVVLPFLLARELLEAKRPQAAMDAADMGFASLSGRTGPLWSLVEGQGRYTRALAHWQLGQLALAEVDLDAAIRCFSGRSSSPELLSALVARGRLRGERKNVPGMCADYSAACLAGDCAAMELTRGQCAQAQDNGEK